MPMKEERPGVWRGDLWHQGRRVKLTFHGSAKEAKAYEAKKRLEAEQSGIVNARDVMPFKDFVENKYKPNAELELRDSTFKIRKYQLNTLVDFFGPMKLTKIDEQQIDAFKKKRSGSAANTINTELNVLSAVLAYARYLKLPCSNPKMRRLPVRKKKGNVKFYTREEVGFIWTACGEAVPEFLPLVVFLFETGSRKSEAINLAWPNVRLDQRVVRIWSEVDDDEDDEDEDDDEEEYLVKSREREVPLSDNLVTILKELKLRGLSREWVFPVRQNNTGNTKGERYAHFPKHTWNRVLVRATELARKRNPEAREIKGGPHRARHTYASHFLERRPDLFLLGKVLGHSHSAVTELYGHLLPEHMAEARNLVTFDAAPIKPATRTRTRRSRQDSARSASAE